jgi:hypothetical protein
VSQAYNSSTWEQREDHKFKESLGYIARTCFKKENILLLTGFFLYIMLYNHIPQKKKNPHIPPSSAPTPL